jgi:S1-C subfamily serine protease
VEKLMRRSAFRGAFLFLALLLVSSCVSSPVSESGKDSYRALKADELDSLASKEPERALEAVWLLALEPESPGILDESVLHAATLKALAALRQRFSVEMEQGMWKEAWATLASLDALAGLPFPEDSPPDLRPMSANPLRLRIMLGIADGYRARGLYAPAASWFSRLLSLPDAAIDPAVLEQWARWAEGEGDLKTAFRLQKLIKQQNTPGTVEGASEEMKPEPALALQMKSVVTVYVDKGLAIRNGLSYPDRVLGSAFQVDRKGYYLTNYHVIASEVDPDYEGYSRLSIRPSENPEARIPAKVVGWNKDLDLALIKSAEIAPATLYGAGLDGSIPKLEKGTRIYAVGSPVGLQNSMTSGIVSAPGRRILPRGEALQIDAPVNPGNSGGPLLDERGALAGIVFAGLSGFQGLNFALPVSWIATVFPQLFDEGKVETSWLGIGIARNLDGSLDVSYVMPGVEGFREGDRLVALGGKVPKDIADAQMVLAQSPMGSLIHVTIERDGKRLEFLSRTSPFPDLPLKAASSRDSAERLVQGTMGMRLEHVSGPRGAGGTYKVLKIWPGMAADESGINQSDVLRLRRHFVERDSGILTLDLELKSLASGYLEKTMRIRLSLAMDNFL